MYRFEIKHRSDGKATHTHGQHSAPSGNALARLLVEAGEPDGAVQAGREGRNDWSARSLHALAAKTLTEGERGFRWGIYAPFPVRDLHLALQSAVSRCVEATKDGAKGRGRMTSVGEGVETAVEGAAG